MIINVIDKEPAEKMYHSAFANVQCIYEYAHGAHILYVHMMDYYKVLSSTQFVSVSHVSRRVFFYLNKLT